MISNALRTLLGPASSKSRGWRRKPKKKRRLNLEPLEGRQMLTLVGIAPNFPLTFFDSTGQFQYSAITHALDVDATPLSFLQSSSSTPTPITGMAGLGIHVLVDNSGNLIGGNPLYLESFQMTGTVVVNSVTYSGTLLTGNVLQFGYQYNSGTSTAEFDFRFQLTGGSLDSFFAGMDIGLVMDSENSTTFTGSFRTDFSGGAKGELGPIASLPASINGYKFDDLNGSGVDNSDPRLSGWTIDLTGTDDLGNPVSLSTTTNSTGEYAFADLVPGTYTVSEVQQTGWTKSVGGTTVTLTSGEEAVAYSGEAGTLQPGQFETVTAGLAFGNFEQTSIHGYKFDDLNGNGVDNSDPRLSGWTIDLTGTNNTGGAVSMTTTTNASGEYSFTGLTPGTYTISEVQQTGWTKSVGGTTVTLTSGEEAVAYSGEAGTLLPGQFETITAGLAFGNFEQTSINGYKFEDLNGSGVDNSDPRLNGWTIILTGTNNLGNPVSETTTTATTAVGVGEYSFTGLTPGTYTISEVQQTGWTKSVGGTTITLTSGEEAVAYSGEAGTLLPGQAETVTAGLAFGNFEQTSIHGYKFDDLNGSGVDNSDPRLGGWTIVLTGTNNTGGAVSMTTTTIADGEYSFTGLTPGKYTISEVQQPGWTKSVGGTTVTLTSGEEAVAYSGEAGTLLPGQFETVTAGLAFGNFEETSINGYKFDDLNGNGVDNSDPRLGGWTIVLTGTNNTGGAVSMTTTTIADGEYSFTGLTPGTYTISEVQQTGWTKSVGGTTVTLTSGEEAVAYSGEAGTLLPGQFETVTAGLAFGNFEQTSIHGYKFDDLNGNGVDNSDPRLNGWTIVLTGTNNLGNAVSETTTTATNSVDVGEYSFTGLTPGTYTISEVQQTGWTKSVGGTTVTLTSGEEAVAYSGEAGTLLPGQFETVTAGLAFGNFEQTSIHGYKFNDLNGSGVDNSDPRLNGWTIVLTGTNNLGNIVSESTTTATNAEGVGEYSFTGLTPGTYTISEQQQTGWTKSVGGTTITLTSGEEAVAYSGEAGTLLPGQAETVTAGLAFGNFEQTSIHGYKFDDLNGSGVDNSDPRLSGWTIDLTGTNNTGSAVSMTTTTNAVGEYSFTGLTPGTYTISEVQQTGWTKSVGGTTITLTSGEEAVAYSGEAGTLLPGQAETFTAGLAFGNFEQAAIYGYKFDDVNDSGVVNDSDPRLNGWTITLTGTNNLGNAVSESTITATTSAGVGEYSFTGLTPGTYTISEVQQSGWTRTTGGTTITLTSGEVAVAYSGEEGALLSNQTAAVTGGLAFGNYKPSNIVIGMGKSPATSQSVEVIDPATGAVVTQFVPYGTTSLGGINVATGDLNDSGFDDIVTGPGRGTAPEINVYDQTGKLLTQFQAYPSSVNGGVEVATADLFGNGLEDIITVPTWGPAEVRVFKNLGTVGGMPMFSAAPTLDFLAFPSSFIGGAALASAGTGSAPNGDAEIIVGSGAGMPATVNVFDVNSTTSFTPGAVAAPTTSFAPFSTASQTYEGGVSLSIAQLTANSLPDIVVGAGADGGSLVNIWGWNTASSAFTSLAAAGVSGFPAFSGPSSNAPINVASLNNSAGITDAILAVQGPGGTTGQVVELDITSVSPLVLSAPTPIPGTYPGPFNIAAIDSVMSGLTTARTLGPAPSANTGNSTAARTSVANVGNAAPKTSSAASAADSASVSTTAGASTTTVAKTSVASAAATPPMVSAGKPPTVAQTAVVPTPATTSQKTQAAPPPPPPAANVAKIGRPPIL
jgi:protocatechuate 3,4-dioxygenase beta subunit